MGQRAKGRNFGIRKAECGFKPIPPELKSDEKKYTQ
jgi:hypothetical protein